MPTQVCFSVSRQFLHLILKLNYHFSSVFLSWDIRNEIGNKNFRRYFVIKLIKWHVSVQQKVFSAPLHAIICFREAKDKSLLSFVTMRRKFAIS